MRKISLLMGAVGGAMAGYLLSNDKLRTELMNAKNADEAAKALGKHLQTDGKKVAGEMQKFAKSDEVQKNVSKAKKYALSQWSNAEKKMKTWVKKGSVGANRAVKKSAKVVKSTFQTKKA
jgi:hypothetical protein